MAEIIKDVPYASQSAAQKLDIYFPERVKGPVPVVVWLHPGGFAAGDKDMAKANAGALAARGYATVSANYRLAGEARFPAQIFDAKAAVRWVRANAGKYNFNTNRIATWGISAGATLAALLGTAGNVKELEDLSMGNATESSRVDAVIDWFGPIDFLTMSSQRQHTSPKPAPENDKSGESLMFGGPVSAVPEKYKAASAIYYVNAECPPFYIQHGSTDEVVPSQQSIDFAKALEAAIGKENVELHLIDNAGHFDRAHVSNENIRASIDFLDNHLKK
jgi:acetyl esterase/lipase